MGLLGFACKLMQFCSASGMYCITSGQPIKAGNKEGKIHMQINTAAALQSWSPLQSPRIDCQGLTERPVLHGAVCCFSMLGGYYITWSGTSATVRYVTQWSGRSRDTCKRGAAYYIRQASIIWPLPMGDIPAPMPPDASNAGRWRSLAGCYSPIPSCLAFSSS